MKSFPVVLVCIAAVICNSCARSPYSVPRPVPLQHNDYSGITETTQLSDFIARYFPGAVPVFSMGSQQLDATKAEEVGYYIKQVCTLARQARVKQNFVPNIEQLKLRLYNGDDEVTATLKDPSPVINSEHFNPEKNVTIFIPGWQESGDSNDHSRIIGQGYMQRGNVNYIVADVNKYVDSLTNWASLNVVYLGRALSDVIVALSEKVPAARIHIIGAGLGANIAGIAGKHFFRETHQKIGRITGLDPALPCLYRGMVLGKEAAAFVDIIHTSSGLLGSSDATGHVDFYPNGLVSEQPDCYSAFCSQGLAAEFYAVSIYPGSENHFMAVPCDYIEENDVESCNGQKVAMGYATPRNVSGIYYLKTNSKRPYGQNSA